LLVAVEGIAPYLHCQDPTNTDAPGFNVQLPPANPQDKYICTHMDTYVAGKKYAHELDAWINSNCSKGGL